MNKKLLAATVAGAFSAPAAALAQSSFVQVYGTLNVDLQYVSSDDPTPVPPAGINGAVFRGTTRPLGTAPVNNNIPGQMALSSNSSNIGFRGSEDLGNGWKAIFQLESALNIDSGGGNLGGRNSNAGLTGNWGTAFYGLWDTPFKTMLGRNYPFFGTSAAAFTGLFGTPGYNIFGGTQTTPTLLANANASDAAAFDRRQTNTVAYWTPNFAGFSARVHYVPGEKKSSVIALGYAAPQSLNPWMWSIAATYDRGPIYAAVGYEQHKDYFGTRVFTGGTGVTGTASDDWGVRAIIGMQDVPRGLLLYVLYERLKYSTDGVVVTGQISDFRRDAVGIMGTYTFGNFVMRGGWAKAFDPCAVPSGQSVSTTAWVRISTAWAFRTCSPSERRFTSSVPSRRTTRSPATSMGGTPGRFLLGATPWSASAPSRPRLRWESATPFNESRYGCF